MGSPPTAAASVTGIGQALAAHGLHVRGGFVADAADELPRVAGAAPARAVLLVGNVGSSLWEAFRAAPELHDGRPDPLDRWSRRIGDEIADRFGALAVYPFGGPPHYPFQRWARRAEALPASPIGLLIHPHHGLWHAYRFALLLAAVPPDLPTAPGQPSPCASCAERPCLNACPVAAFGARGYDVVACASLLRAQPDGACAAEGCLARRACPHGTHARYRPEHARFHMHAFIDARRAAL